MLSHSASFNPLNNLIESRILLLSLFNFNSHSFTSISISNQQHQNKNPEFHQENQKRKEKKNDKNSTDNLVSIIRKLGHLGILLDVPLHILDRILPYFPQTNPQDPTRILQLSDLTLPRHPRRNIGLRRNSLRQPPGLRRPQHKLPETRPRLQRRLLPHRSAPLCFFLP